MIFSSSSSPLLLLLGLVPLKKILSVRWVGGCDASAGGHISRELGHLSSLSSISFSLMVISTFSTLAVFLIRVQTHCIVSIYFHARTAARCKALRLWNELVLRVISLLSSSFKPFLAPQTLGPEYIHRPNKLHTLYPPSLPPPPPPPPLRLPLEATPVT